MNVINIRKIIGFLAVFALLLSALPGLAARAEESGGQTEDIAVTGEGQLQGENTDAESGAGEADQNPEIPADGPVGSGAEIFGMTSVSGGDADIMQAADVPLSYTDEKGNEFTYELDGEGNATVTGIRVSGQPLEVPSVIDGAAVCAIENGTGCVVINPLTRIEELTVNGDIRIGVKAFSGLTIGTLTIGEGVNRFSVYSADNYTHYWQQFASSSIDRVVYEAVEIPISIPVETVQSTNNYGPFYQARVREIVFGANVKLIPEFLFKDAFLDLDELTVNAERIGAEAFAGSGIRITKLTLGEDVKTLEQESDNMALNFFWCQFKGAQIGTLRLESADLDLGHTKAPTASMSPFGPFCFATVDHFEIGGRVTRIPEYFLCQATLEQDELTVNVPYIGAYAFGMENISIGTLTIGEKAETFGESYFTTQSTHYYCQFQSANIGTLRFLPGALKLQNEKGISLTNSVFAPFHGASVGSLVIGDDVRKIPEYFLNNARLEMEELTINVPEIGGHAFSSPNISFGTLTIGENVTNFSETFISTDLKHYWNNFQDCTIGHLNYLSPAAATTHVNTGMGSLSSDIFPPFQNASIGDLTLAQDIACIPDYLFYKAKFTKDELTLDIPVLGAFSFSSPNIHIRSLTIGESVTTFSLAPDSTSAYLRWQQSDSSTIDELHYNAPNAQTAGFIGDDKYYFGPFCQSKIGHLYLGSGVEQIPNYCFASACLTQEELEIHVPVVCPGAFNSTAIQIGVLTLGEEVEQFPYLKTYSLCYFRQFAGTKIGTVRLLSPHIQTNTSCYKGPFEDSTINGLEIGEKTEVISDNLFLHARMTVGELTLEDISVGYMAFSSSNNKFETLNIGGEVLYAGMGKYTGSPAYTMNVFEDAKITNLNYNGTGTPALWTNSSGVSGMFAEAVISRLNIGEGAEQIPAGWFRNAVMTLDELTVPCGWSAYSFSSSAIKITRLNLVGDFGQLAPSSYYDYGFQKNTIGTVYYNIPNLKFNVGASYAGSPFYEAKITDFIVGEDVVFLDDGLLRKCSFTNCHVYAVEASESYKAQNLADSSLPSCTSLYVHYNSDFRDYFQRNAGSAEWMCLDFLEEESRDKVYNEETGEYVLEILNKCSVCGFCVTTEEGLDDTYEIYLSLPVGIALAFDPEQKAYAGDAAVYAYGRLGNAYEGVRVYVDVESEGYGTARKAEEDGAGEAVDILAYLSAGFGGGSVFSPAELSQNKTAAENGDEALPYGKQLQVSVDGLAFWESGPGSYCVPIPLKIELTR